MRMDNAIAELASRVRPEATVTHLVYANHVELPEVERPTPGMKISFVPFGRDFAWPFTDPRANMQNPSHPWSLELIKDWAQLCTETGAGLIEHTKAFRHRWMTFAAAATAPEGRHALVAQRRCRRFNAPRGGGLWAKISRRSTRDSCGT
jgi:hypothetical protein